ncbi:hypothetical protein T11_8387 [Trichinella zimbabwensis]|uniref:Uncharacterized protein n=1 Tax=Trichinella zimbabwensis TaxID=268475 RepID=A0A0V1I069_9BILA|nr:hypothetical protein T11_8387 [Trichinella zimbabwensis]
MFIFKTVPAVGVVCSPRRRALALFQQTQHSRLEHKRELSLKNPIDFLSQANTIIVVSGQGDFPIGRPVAPYCRVNIGNKFPSSSSENSIIDATRFIQTSNSVLQKLPGSKLAKWEICFLFCQSNKKQKTNKKERKLNLKKSKPTVLAVRRRERKCEREAFCHNTSALLSRLERAMELRLGVISCGLGGPICFRLRSPGCSRGRGPILTNDRITCVLAVTDPGQRGVSRTVRAAHARSEPNIRSKCVQYKKQIEEEDMDGWMDVSRLGGFSSSLLLLLLLLLSWEGRAKANAREHERQRIFLAT